jgi:hypothetical protein
MPLFVGVAVDAVTALDGIRDARARYRAGLVISQPILAIIRANALASERPTAAYADKADITHPGCL